MEIPKYNTFTEKSNNFRIEKVDNIDRFTEIYNEHKHSKGIYRGINSSSFKIYSSLQREFILTGNNKDYLTALKSNQYVLEYFKLANIPQTDLSFYSILQHFGKPTPIIDFTKNFSKALFFSLDKVSGEINSELDNYVSLFFISTNDFDLISIVNLLSHISNWYNKFEILTQSYEDYSPQKALEFSEKHFNIVNEGVFLLEENDNYKDIVDIKNNHRIIIQEGVFISNQYKYDKLKPLEESLKLFLEEESKLSYYSPWDELPMYIPENKKRVEEYEEYVDKVKSYQKRLEKNILVSYEINKLLIDDIRNKFDIPNNDLIYFDLEKIIDKI